MGAQSVAPTVTPESAPETENPRSFNIDRSEAAEQGLKQTSKGREIGRILPWEATVRGPLNLKFLELQGKYKDIFDALGGGDAFIAELRRDPVDPKP